MIRPKSPVRRAFSFAVSVVIVAIVALASGAGGYYTKHTPEEVQHAIDSTRVIGATPEETVQKLRAIRLLGGDSLVVIGFIPEFSRVQATIREARRDKNGVWSIEVEVVFDSTQKATTVSVHYYQ
jgi:hypothetical protein